MSLILFNLIDRSARRRRGTGGPGLRRRTCRSAPAMRSRWCCATATSLLMALVIFLLNWVNSAGEYILSVDRQAGGRRGGRGRDALGGRRGPLHRRVLRRLLPDRQHRRHAAAALRRVAGGEVSRRTGRAVHPAGGRARAATRWRRCIPSLAIMRWVKTAENSVDYSLMNTVRQMLFLPTTREEKYKAKQVIDSFVVRIGDVLSAGTVYLGTTFFALTVSQFAWINVVLVLAGSSWPWRPGSSFSAGRRSAAHAGRRRTPEACADPSTNAHPGIDRRFRCEIALADADLSRTLTRFAASAAAARCRRVGGAARRRSTGAGSSEMKDSPRGPFSAIKWFCKDGRVLPPKDYACAGKGQGWQHGEWSDRTRQMRAQGFQVANAAGRHRRRQGGRRPGLRRHVRAVAGGEVPDRHRRRLDPAQGAVLSRRDPGRGRARRRARACCTAMAARDDWIGWRYPALRGGVRLLPHGADDASAQKVRNMAAALADRDPAFQRAARQDPRQPGRLRRRARARLGRASSPMPRRASRPMALAAEIDRVYAGAADGATPGGASRRRWPRRPALPSALAEAQRRYAAGADAPSSGYPVRPSC